MTPRSNCIPSNTHAIILAAGLGSRLKENTREVPKCLVPVSGRPILERMLETLETVGVRNITIVVGYLHQAIREFVAQWREAGHNDVAVDFVLNPMFSSSGSVRSLQLGLQAREASIEQQHALLIEGDVVIEAALLEKLFSRSFASTDAATLLAAFDPSLTGTFAMTDHGMVTAWLHESVREPSFDLTTSYKTVNLTLVRHGKARRALVAAVTRIVEEYGTNAPLEYAMHQLVLGGMRIGAVTTDGLPWFEVDTPEDLVIANAMFAPAAEAA